MSHFFGILRGRGTKSTHKTGTKASGMEAILKNEHCRAVIQVWHNTFTGKDHFTFQFKDKNGWTKCQVEIKVKEDGSYELIA